MMNREQEGAVCDATSADSSTEAGLTIINKPAYKVTH